MKPGIPPDTFQTPRLRLRRPTDADAAAIFQRWTQDPDVTRYLVWTPHTSVAESEAHISRCQASWDEGTAFVWFLEDRTSGELEGTLCRWEHHPNLGPDPRDALCYSRVRE